MEYEERVCGWDVCARERERIKHSIVFHLNVIYVYIVYIDTAWHTPAPPPTPGTDTGLFCCEVLPMPSSPKPL